MMGFRMCSSELLHAAHCCSCILIVPFVKLYNVIIKISRQTGYELWSWLVYMCLVVSCTCVEGMCYVQLASVCACPVVSCTCVEAMCYVELASVCVCPVVSCTCVEGICLSVAYFCSRRKNSLNNAVSFM